MVDITMTTFKRLSSFILSLNTTYRTHPLEKVGVLTTKRKPPFCAVQILSHFSMMMAGAVAVAVGAGLDKAPV
jgi:hypothetical protein